MYLKELEVRARRRRVKTEPMKASRSSPGSAHLPETRSMDRGASSSIWCPFSHFALGGPIRRRRRAEFEARPLGEVTLALIYENPRVAPRPMPDELCASKCIFVESELAREVSPHLLLPI
ncbi:hypothetical protein KM043_000501 [Ampulex compressa]|nr:hypothetical protein KM043_000501 [Ampulex compressa]